MKKYGVYLFIVSLVLVGCQSTPPAPVVPIPSRTIDITVRNWAFSPATISAKKGEKITLQLHGESGVHGFSVPDLGINKTVRPGEVISVDLPTEAAGSYRFFCSVPCGQGHIDMNGMMTVEE